MDKGQKRLAKKLLKKLEGLISNGAYLDSESNKKEFEKNRKLYEKDDYVDRNYRVGFSDIFILVSANLSTLIYGKEHAPWTSDNINVQEIGEAVDYLKLAALAKEFLGSI